MRVTMVENNRAVIENQLLKRLLGLPRSTEPEKEISTSVRLLAEVTGATTAYLELTAGDPPVPRFARGYDAAGADVADVICRGAIALSIAESTLIESKSARSDARFRDLGSVRRNEIEALLCAPIISGDLVGAICVQRRSQGGAFSDGDARVVEYFAQQFAMIAPRLAPSEPAPVRLHDEIRRLQESLVRDALARTKGNVAQAARELHVARSFVYSVVPNVSRPSRSGRGA